MRTTVIDGKIQLYNYIDNEAVARVFKVGVLPKDMATDWNNQTLNLIDWKIDGNAVKVTYQIREDLYAPILDATLPLATDVIPLRPPTRSRNWAWNSFSEVWVNRATGERYRP